MAFHCVELVIDCIVLLILVLEIWCLEVLVVVVDGGLIDVDLEFDVLFFQLCCVWWLIYCLYDGIEI